MKEIKINMENLSQEEREQLLKLVMRGQKPVEEEWPQPGDKYYYVDVYRDVSWRLFFDDELGKACAKTGNMFRTEEEAEWYREHLEVCAELRRMADGSVRDSMWYIPYYNSLKDHVFVYMHDGYSESPYIFASDESAQKAIDTIGEERMKKYWFRVEG